MAVYENSRYLQSTLVDRQDNKAITLGFRQRPNFNMQEGTLYEWQASDTLDGLAFKEYGYCNLRWAILDANPQYRSELDIKAGDTIFLPDYEEVIELVNPEIEEEGE